MKVFIYSFLLVREKPTNKNAPNKAQNNIQNIIYFLKDLKTKLKTLRIKPQYESINIKVAIFFKISIFLIF